MFFGQPFGGIIPGARGAVLSVLLRTGTPLTGRQIHRLLSDDFSLWSIQESLKALSQLGLVDTQIIGRANVHTINESHTAVATLRQLADPVAALKAVIDSAVDSRVQAVILFGSIARGEGSSDSDIDLAVIAESGWDGGIALEDAVRTQIGNECDVVVFTENQLRASVDTGEPVVSDILRDGVAVMGSKPRVKKAA